MANNTLGIRTMVLKLTNDVKNAIVVIKAETATNGYFIGSHKAELYRNMNELPEKYHNAANVKRYKYVKPGYAYYLSNEVGEYFYPNFPRCQMDHYRCIAEYCKYSGDDYRNCTKLIL